MPGMMNTILNLGLNDETTRGPGEARPAIRASPTTAIAASSRCSAKSRWTSTWRSSTTSSMRARGRSKVKLDTDLTADDLQGDHRRIQEAGPEGDRASRFRRTPREQLTHVARCRVPLLVELPRPPTTARWKRFRTISAPRPTCRRWCSATWAKLRAPASASRAIPAPAKRCSTASS